MRRSSHRHGWRSQRRGITQSSAFETRLGSASTDTSYDKDSVLFSPSSYSQPTRRSILKNTLLTTTCAILSTQILSNKPANAAIGTLPEFADTNAIFQSVTIDVTDKKQFDDTVEFFTNGFDGCKVLRERGGDGGGVVKEVVSIAVVYLLDSSVLDVLTLYSLCNTRSG
jgi:hypothetical protein